MNIRSTWFGTAWLLLAGVSAATAASHDLRLIDATKKADLQTVRSLVAQHVDVNAAEGILHGVVAIVIELPVVNIAA